MATSFAAYASQYLNRQAAPGGSTSLNASSQPMFFSFSTDDGSRAGHGVDTDLDDTDDPHLRQSHRGYAEDDEDDDDPYLRLDEDGTGNNDPRAQQSIPLIASDHGSVSSGSPKGWLAHLAAAPSPMPMRARSPSPSSSSDSSDPPPDLFAPSTSRSPPAPRQHQPHRQLKHPQQQYTPFRAPPPPPTHADPTSLSLTESLLPRDGLSRPLDVFSLPDPRHLPRSRRKYQDSLWTALWLSGVSLCVFFALLLLFVAHEPSNGGGIRLPYTTLLHTVPLLTILTFLSAVVAYSHIWLLRVFVKPVMVATEVFVPATLFVCAIWAFVGSFMWEEGQEPTWGETVGLRLFAIIPLLLSLLTARRLLHLPRQIHSTSTTLTLSTHLLLLHPYLLLLSPCILLLTLLTSIPFLTLIFRLLLIGYTRVPDGSSRVEWHLHGWANWALVASAGVWLWSWGVARGVLRVVVAGVVGGWYFADPDVPPPPPSSTHTLHSALTRATGPSLGTIALSALLLTLIRLLTLLTLFLHRLPLVLARLSIPLTAPVLLTALRSATGYLEGATTALSKYALVYAGLTGDGFMQSARRARALATTRDASRNGRGKGRARVEPPLTLLTIAPLTLTFPFALGTYLFVAHTLGAPQQALGAAVLAGGVTALVGLFCVGLVKDTADTLYMCYCIDKDGGERRREEVFVIFEYDAPRAPQPPSASGLPAPVTQPRGQQQQQKRKTEPEQIVPLSPARPAAQGLPQHQHQRTPSYPQQHQRTSSYPHSQHQRTPSYPEPRQPLPTRSPVPAEAEEDTDPNPFLHGLGLGSGLMEESTESTGAVERMMRDAQEMDMGLDLSADVDREREREREANRKQPMPSGDSDSEADSVAGEGEESGGYFPGSGFF